MQIRLAKLQDAAEVLHIYNHYIENSVASFEYDPLGLKEFEDRMNTIMEEYPFLVIEEDERMIGYAYAHRMFDRKAYQWDVELTQYFHQEYTGKGYGSILFQTLLDLLQKQNVVNAYSLICLPNEKSEGMQKKFGFRLAGVYHNTGYKAGRWLDVGIYEKALQPHVEQPAPFLPFPSLLEEEVQEVVSQRVLMNNRSI